MKKLILTSSFLLFCLSMLISQSSSITFTAKWGPETKASRLSTLKDIIGRDDSGIYAIKAEDDQPYLRSSTVLIEHYDHDMKLTVGRELELEAQDKSLIYEFATQIEDDLYVFSSFINQKLKKNFLFVQSLDKQTLEVNDDLKKIAEIDFTETGKYDAGKFKYTVSRDSSKLLIYYQAPVRNEKKEDKQLGLYVFDSEFTEQWSSFISFPYETNLFSLRDIEVDEYGNVHLIGLTFNEKRKMHIDGEPNYKFHLFSFLDQGTTQKTKPLHADADRHIASALLAVQDGKVICAGYAATNKRLPVDGVFMLQFDVTTQAAIARNFQQFDTEWIKDRMTKKDMKSTKKILKEREAIGLHSHRLKDLILSNQGGVILIGEQYWRETKVPVNTTNDPFNSSNKIHYYNHNNISVINLSPEGELVWAEKIVKRQRTSNDEGAYSSYALAVVEDKLHFVLNDHAKNLPDARKNNTVYTFKKTISLINLITIDSEGNQTRAIIEDLDTPLLIAKPRMFEQTTKNEIIVFGEFKKMHRFGKITFE